MVDTTQQPARPFAWRSLAPSWALIAGMIAFVKALGCARDLLNDPDTYLHVAAGNWMLAQHALPAQDPFSHTMPGAHWVVHEWLAEIVLAVTYNALGWWGLVFLAASCFALTVALIARWLTNRLDPKAMLLLVTMSLLLLLPHLLARPHLLADPLVVVWCGAIVAARDAGRTPSLLLLPVMTLWANLHAGFMLGVAVAAYFSGEAVLAAPTMAGRWAVARRWGGFTLLALLASAITPNGLDGLLLPVSFLHKPVMYEFITEWKSWNFEQFGPFEFWLLALIALGWSSGLKLPPTRLLLILGMTHMTLQHGRHIDLIAMISPMAMAAPLGAQLRGLLGGQQESSFSHKIAALTRPAEPAAVATALLAIAATAALLASAPLVRKDGPETPGAALAAAERLHLDGPVFNAQGFGGFLIFSHVKPFIDGRMEMYGDAFLERFIDAAAGEEPVLDDMLNRYGITWTLLRPQDGAVHVLDHQPGWQRVYADEFAVIHARVTAE